MLFVWLHSVLNGGNLAIVKSLNDWRSTQSHEAHSSPALFGMVASLIQNEARSATVQNPAGVKCFSTTGSRSTIF